MTEYDPSIIQTFVDRLYARANQIVVLCAAVGAFLGLGAGFSITSLVSGGESGLGVITLVLGAAATAIGYLIGQERSFVLRLQAQTALCQVQIEKNTRQLAKGAV